MTNVTVLDELNFRIAYGTSARVIRTLVKGEVLEYLDVRVKSGGYTWAKLRDACGDVGWASDHRLVFDHETPEDGGIPVDHPLVGVHAAGRSYGRLIDTAARLHVMGRPIPLVVIVNHTGLGEEIQRVSPTTRTVFRQVQGTDDPDPFGDHEDGGGWWRARDWFDRMWSLGHSQARGVTWHQLYNECNFHGNSQSEAYASKVASFELELMQIAESHGVRVAFGNYMPGVPEKRHFERLRGVYERAQAFGHALCYHAYTAIDQDATFEAAAPYFALRWRDWVRDYPRLAVVLGEAGHYHAPRFRGWENQVQRMTELQRLLRPYTLDGRFVAAAYWTVGGQGDPLWNADDFTPHLFDGFTTWATSNWG